MLQLESFCNNEFPFVTFSFVVYYKVLPFIPLEVKAILVLSRDSFVKTSVMMEPMNMRQTSNKYRSFSVKL